MGCPITEGLSSAVSQFWDLEGCVLSSGHFDLLPASVVLQTQAEQVKHLHLALGIGAGFPSSMWDPARKVVLFWSTLSLPGVLAEQSVGTNKSFV